MQHKLTNQSSDDCRTSDKKDRTAREYSNGNPDFKKEIDLRYLGEHVDFKNKIDLRYAGDDKEVTQKTKHFIEIMLLFLTKIPARLSTNMPSLFSSDELRKIRI